MNTPKRPTALMTVAQVICAAAIPLTLIFSLLPLVSSVNYILQADFASYDNTLLVAIIQAFHALRDLILGTCFVWLEAEAFRICGRVRSSSAFSPPNVTSLGRIAAALLIAGVIALFFGDSIVPYLLTGLPPIHPTIQAFLLPFTLLTLALMVRAVQVLMRRAVDMQEETDLTV